MGLNRAKKKKSVHVALVYSIFKKKKKSNEYIEDTIQEHIMFSIGKPSRHLLMASVGDQHHQVTVVCRTALLLAKFLKILLFDKYLKIRIPLF